MPPILDKYLNDTLKVPPLVFYRMREGSGTVMTDSSPNVNNGTYSATGINWIVNNTTVANSYTASNGKNVPLFNSYLTTVDWSTSPLPTYTYPYVSYFDGAAGRATATLNSPAINTSAASSVTVEMWVKWDGVLAGANGTFEALANFAGATGLLLGFLKNGAADYRFGLSVRNTGDLWGLSNATTLALLTRDVYHHIVFVIVNNAVQTSKLYIDGVQATMTQQIGTSTTTDSVTSAFALGYDGTASFFNGGISEVAVYNGEPYNATAVKNRYHQGAYGAEYQEYATVPGIEGQVELGSFSFAMNDKNQPGPGNRTRTTNQFYLDEIGGLDDADIRFSEESNFYRDGTNPLTSKYGGRTLTFSGTIEAANFQKLRQMQTQLKYSVASLSEFQVIFRNIWNNGLDFMTNARKNTSVQIAENQQQASARRKYLITLRSSFPYLESVGSRTDIVLMGATVALPHKGNAPAQPVFTFWGPFYDARLVIGSTTLKLLGTLAASSFVTIDSKARTCTSWPLFDPSSDFPVINGYPGPISDFFVSYAQFVSVSGGTAGVSRVEITWKHTVL